jgi:mRNA-degrading endonuclease toxin of MazEF toxin-antitoxin module
VRRGEIWWASPTLAGGSRKRRPFLVVSSDAFNRNDRYPKVLVVHLTSVPRAQGPFRWEVDVPRGTGGLPIGSVVKCAEIYTVLKTQLGEMVGTLPASYMARVDRALGIVLELPTA